MASSLSDLLTHFNHTNEIKAAHYTNPNLRGIAILVERERIVDPTFQLTMENYLYYLVTPFVTEQINQRYQAKFPFRTLDDHYIQSQIAQEALRSLYPEVLKAPPRQKAIFFDPKVLDDV